MKTIKILLLLTGLSISSMGLGSGFDSGANFEKCECPICFNPLVFNTAKTTSCNHSFCKTCINKWLKTKDTCPMCRQTLKAEALPNMSASVNLEREISPGADLSEPILRGANLSNAILIES